MTRRWQRLLLAGTVVLLTLLSPSAALAHSSQVGSTPQAGATLDTPPREVTVEFDTPLLDIGAAMIVRTDAGVVVSTGTPRVDRRTLAVSIAPDAPDGTYTVAYRVVSKDGHTVESTFDFRVGTAQSSAASSASSSAPSTAPSAAPAATAVATASGIAPGQGSSPLVWMVVGVLVVAVVGAGVVLFRR